MSRRAICMFAAMMLMVPFMGAGERRTTALRAVYRGSAAAMAALNSGSARPLGLASADFNEDGFPDLAAAYDVSFGGALAIHYGAATTPIGFEATPLG